MQMGHRQEEDREGSSEKTMQSERERQKLRRSWSCSNKPARNGNAIDMFMSFAHKYLHDSLR